MNHFMHEPAAGLFEVFVPDEGSSGRLEFVSSFPPLVYVLYRGRIIAEFEEVELRDWLQSPGTPLAAGDVQLSASQSATEELTIRVSLPNDLSRDLTAHEWGEFSRIIQRTCK